MLFATMRTTPLFVCQWAGRQQIVRPSLCSRRIWCQPAGCGIAYALDRVQTKLLLAVAAANETMVATDAITDAWWLCNPVGALPNALSVKTKLLLATTGMDETIVAIGTITDGDYADVKVQRGLMRSMTASPEQRCGLCHLVSVWPSRRFCSFTMRICSAPSSPRSNVWPN